MTLLWVPAITSYESIRRLKEITAEAATLINSTSSPPPHQSSPSYGTSRAAKPFGNMARRPPPKPSVLCPPSTANQQTTWIHPRHSRVIPAGTLHCYPPSHRTRLYQGILRATSTACPRPTRLSLQHHHPSKHPPTSATQWPVFQGAREHHINPTIPTLSINIIFGTRAGGAALAKFIEETWTCVQPRRREPLPEDHG
jgi:hypothetical protein